MNKANNINEEEIQIRISVLVAELSECREDERNAQNQILEVISIAGTILGLLFGTSYLASGEKNQPFEILSEVQNCKIPGIGKLVTNISVYLTNTRAVFALSLLIFCMAFTYITVIGIGNLLRYYYIQNLEDRLHTLSSNTPDNQDRGPFLHWNAYCAPIVTRNIKHITSSHTLLYFSLYTIAAICAVVFSMGIVMSLFVQINPIKWFDVMALVIVLLFMVAAFYLFLRLSSHAEDVMQFSWDVAHANQEIRLTENGREPYSKGKSYRNYLIYLIYPKKQDLQKPALIVLGFIFSLFWTGEQMNLECFFRVLFVLFIFDFLSYQARYQINDIRGIYEDIQMKAKNRFVDKTEGIEQKHAIRISVKVAFFRLLLAILLTLFLGYKLRWHLLIAIVILVFSTIVYEYVRAKKRIWAVFISVGAGYPLRFFLGFLSVTPDRADILLQNFMICLIITLWLYGGFSSLLVWVSEVIARMQENQNRTGKFPESYEKRHYAYLQSIIEKRFVSAEEHLVNGKILPLREKGRLTDPWILFFLLSLAFVIMGIFYLKPPIVLCVIEIVVYGMFLCANYFTGKIRLIPYTIGEILSILNMIISIQIVKNYMPYCLLLSIQVLITVTYILLDYQPQFKKLTFKELITICKVVLMRVVLGEKIVEILHGSKNKN